MPILTYDQVINRLAEKTYDNTKQLRRGVAQRRNGMEDLYGIEFTHNGDASHPATFYISVSPDLVYYERFAFKFIIEPYNSSVAGVNGGGDMTIGSTELTMNVASSHRVLDGTSTLDDTVSGSFSPNPHTHSASGGTGGLTYGIKQLSTASAEWQVVINGVNITEYLIEQHDGDWIDGEGIYPTNSVDDMEDFYDILDVACMLEAEEEYDKRRKLLKPGFKKVQVFSDAPFSLTALLYMKYSHANR